ncbi:MAG: hypothetical protein LBQ77_08025 [Treponema sp.]|nr:hypothetical protein [Treponema sp.]
MTVFAGGSQSAQRARGSKPLVSVINDLNGLRQSLDNTYRWEIYHSALDIIMDRGVEVPVYQRQTGTLFSTQRINMIHCRRI